MKMLLKVLMCQCYIEKLHEKNNSYTDTSQDIFVLAAKNMNILFWHARIICLLRFLIEMISAFAKFKNLL